MEHAATQPLTAGPTSQPDPHPDRLGPRVPDGIAEVHAVLVILSAYGRHLCETLHTRAALRSFTTIARFFGTTAVGTIMAHLVRGMMRCQALDRMLRARARRGVDLKVMRPGTRPPRQQETPATPAPEAQDPPAALTPEQEAAMRAKEARKAERRLARRFAAAHPLTMATLPSMAEIEAEVRRCPVGQTIVLICRDLGAFPSLCSAPFWNRVCDIIMRYRGNMGDIMLEMRRRAVALETNELDRSPHLAWPEQTREADRRALGFFVGEEPVAPPRPSWVRDAVLFSEMPVAVEGFIIVATGPP